MPQGGMAAVEQRLCSGGAMGCGVLGLGAATFGWRGAGKPWGANKGQAGDLGDACLAEPRRRSRRFPLSARGMREECNTLI